jgi:hypothetical protein
VLSVPAATAAEKRAAMSIARSMIGVSTVR